MRKKLHSPKNLSLYFILGIMLTIMLGTIYPYHTEKSGPQRELGLGDIGADVRWLQRELNSKGYNVGAVDGLYGFTTRAKLREFQEKNELKVTGVFDKATYETMTGKKTVNERKPKYSLSEKDLMLLARAVHGEARGESFEGQVAVAAVILNRVESPAFPKTVAGVVFEEGAFDAVDDGQIWLEPSRSSKRAAYVAAQGGDNTGGALYYFNPAKSTSRWIWTRPQITKIGDHIFAK